MDLNNQFHVQLIEPINQNSNEIIDSICEKISRIRAFFGEVSVTNQSLERNRDQYFIHLTQCQEDQEILKNMYKSLRFKYEKQTISFDNSTNLPLFSRNDINKNSNISNPIIQTIDKTEIQYRVDYNPGKIRLCFCLSVKEIISCVRYNADGTLFAFVTGANLFVVQTETGMITNTFSFPQNSASHTNSLAFSPDMKHIASCGVSTDIFLFSLETNSLVTTFHEHTKEASSVIFSPDGEWLISGGYDGLLCIWKIKTLSLISRLTHNVGGIDNPIIAISTTPKAGFYAIAFANGNVGVYNSHFENSIVIFPAHSQSLTFISVSPIDETILTLSQDKTAKLWTMIGIAKCRKILEGHSDFLLGACFSHTSNILCTCSKDQTIRIWDSITGEIVDSIYAHHNSVLSVMHHPHQDQFLSCAADGYVCVWEYNFK